MSSTRKDKNAEALRGPQIEPIIVRFVIYKFLLKNQIIIEIKSY